MPKTIEESQEILRKASIPFLRFILFFFLLLILGRECGIVFAEEAPPYRKENERIAKREVIRTVYHWQMARWKNGETVCNLYLQHDSFPTYGDVMFSCGEDLLQTWLNTPPCTATQAESTENCEGVFLRYLDKSSITVTETVSLPGIQLNLRSHNCRSGEWISQRPALEIHAIEPLDGYQIQHIYVRIGRTEKRYETSDVLLTLPLTDEKGAWITYWADSSYGDSSLPLRVRYRAISSEDGKSFRLDLLTNDEENNLPPAALLWQTFSPIQDMPQVLEEIESPIQLYTENSYLYLAGYLIQTGYADASSCSDGGIYSNGAASPCGEEAAKALVIDWQNRYNAQILQSAKKYNVPPLLLKQIIAQESQFIGESHQPYERGLGHVTESGADMLLSWNTKYSIDICTTLFEDERCAGGYSNLDSYRQTLLRKSVLDKVGTSGELDMLAAMLYASAAQSGQMVENLTGSDSWVTSSYVDMWKISVANYYGGAGCVSDAMKKALKNEEKLSWESLEPYFSDECSLAADYVERVWNLP